MVTSRARWVRPSRLGAFLDPVADKLIVAVALVLLVSKENADMIIPGLEALDGATATLRKESIRAALVLCAIVIIGREIADLRAARMDGGDRAARQGQGVASPSSRPSCRSWAFLHVVPLGPAGAARMHRRPVFQIGFVLSHPSRPS